MNELSVKPATQPTEAPKPINDIRSAAVKAQVSAEKSAVEGQARKTPSTKPIGNSTSTPLRAVIVAVILFAVLVMIAYEAYSHSV